MAGRIQLDFSLTIQATAARIRRRAHRLVKSPRAEKGQRVHGYLGRLWIGRWRRGQRRISIVFELKIAQMGRNRLGLDEPLRFSDRVRQIEREPVDAKELLREDVGQRRIQVILFNILIAVSSGHRSIQVDVASIAAVSVDSIRKAAAVRGSAFGRCGDAPMERRNQVGDRLRSRRCSERESQDQE